MCIIVCEIADNIPNHTTITIINSSASRATYFRYCIISFEIATNISYCTFIKIINRTTICSIKTRNIIVHKIPNNIPNYNLIINSSANSRTCFRMCIVSRKIPVYISNLAITIIINSSAKDFGFSFSIITRKIPNNISNLAPIINSAAINITCFRLCMVACESSFYITNRALIIINSTTIGIVCFRFCIVSREISGYIPNCAVIRIINSAAFGRSFT